MATMKPAIRMAALVKSMVSSQERGLKERVRWGATLSVGKKARPSNPKTQRDGDVRWVPVNFRDSLPRRRLHLADSTRLATRR
jgi:hypothetical protein